MLFENVFFQFTYILHLKEKHKHKYNMIWKYLDKIIIIYFTKFDTYWMTQNYPYILEWRQILAGVRWECVRHKYVHS